MTAMRSKHQPLWTKFVISHQAVVVVTVVVVDLRFPGNIGSPKLCSVSRCLQHSLHTTPAITLTTDILVHLLFCGQAGQFHSMACLIMSDMILFIANKFQTFIEKKSCMISLKKTIHNFYLYVFKISKPV